MKVHVSDSASGAGPVNPGDAAGQGVRVTIAPVPQAQPGSQAITPGVFIPFQADRDTGGALRVVDQELVRERAALEEMRVLTEASELLLLRACSSGSGMWTPFLDRRGGSGQRGTIR